MKFLSLFTNNESFQDKIKFPVAKPAGEAKEVKSLAETIILNAESRGIRAPKKSFVEEVSWNGVNISTTDNFGFDALTWFRFWLVADSNMTLFFLIFHLFL